MRRNSVFSQRMLKILWGRSGNLCAFPNCQEILIKELDKGKYTVVGDMAHIIAASQEGPRGKENDLAPDKISDIILLCPTHHRLIDQNPDIYPPEELQRWKTEHEKTVIDAALGQKRQVLCVTLKSMLKPEPPYEILSSKQYLLVKFKSVKMGYEWIYQVDANSTCGEFANALAEQHFSTFYDSFEWHLSDESGKVYPHKTRLGKALPNKGGTVLLRMNYSAGPFDAASSLPQEWYYWIDELTKSGDFLKYIAEWEKLVEECPNDTRHLNILAWLYCEANMNLDRAEELIKRCTKLNKNMENDPAFMDTSGWLDYRRRKYSLAEMKLLYALDKTQNDNREYYAALDLVLEYQPRIKKLLEVLKLRNIIYPMVGKLWPSLNDMDTNDEFYVILYHLYFVWRALGRTASAEEAKIRIHEWISDNGQDMLIRKRVAENNNSLLIPSCQYLDAQWLNFFEIRKNGGEFNKLEVTP